MPTTQDRDRAALLANLQVLGGRATAEDEVKREGNTFVIPATMTLRDAAGFLLNKDAEEETVISFDRTFRFRPFDGARAAGQVFRSIFGGVVQVNTMFEGAVNVTVDTDVDVTEQVPWGPVKVPLMPGATIHLMQSADPEYGDLFHCHVDAPRKHRFEIEGLFALIEEELRTNSIYRGKAVVGDMSFLDLSHVNPERVTYSDDLMIQAQANLWAMIEHTDAMRLHGISLKRSVLLEGPYGTGKTLMAYLTAKIAVANGWSFHYCRPGVDDLRAVMRTAMLYQPAVVFFEDIDVQADPTSATADNVSRMLDVFDGITNKGTEILCVLTTNHVERIHKGMVRPGRLDAVMHFGPLDQKGVRVLTEDVIPDSARGDLDYGVIHEACRDYMPAFVKEAVERSVRYALARGHGALTRIETQDVVDAANGLRAQYVLMDNAQEHDSNTDNLTTAFGSVVERVVSGYTDSLHMAVNSTRQEIEAKVEEEVYDGKKATKRMLNNTLTYDEDGDCDGSLSVNE